MDELCKQVEWSIQNAMPTFSSFAGLAASLVLASMVIILVEYKGDESPAAAIALFTVTLIGLGADTFIFGAAGGETLCGRGAVQGLLAGSTLATGVPILVAGITLLQAKFAHTHPALNLLGNLVTGMSAAGTMALMAVWSVRLVNNLIIVRLRPPPMVSYAPSLTLIGIFLIVTVVIALATPSVRVQRTASIAVTCVYLLHIVIVVAMYVVTIVIPATQWTVHTGTVVLALTLVVSIAFPFVELTGVVLALDWRGGRTAEARVPEQARRAEPGPRPGHRAGSAPPA
jgi:hypothetical protein